MKTSPWMIPAILLWFVIVASVVLNLADLVAWLLK